MNAMCVILHERRTDYRRVQESKMVMFGYGGQQSVGGNVAIGAIGVLRKRCRVRPQFSDDCTALHW